MDEYSTSLKSCAVARIIIHKDRVLLLPDLLCSVTCPETELRVIQLGAWLSRESRFVQSLDMRSAEGQAGTLPGDPLLMLVNEMVVRRQSAL